MSIAMDTGMHSAMPPVVLPQASQASHHRRGGKVVRSKATKKGMNLEYFCYNVITMEQPNLTTIYL